MNEYKIVWGYTVVLVLVLVRVQIDHPSYEIWVREVASAFRKLSVVWMRSECVILWCDCEVVRRAADRKRSLLECLVKRSEFLIIVTPAR